jgi:hypothetical protein
MIEKFIEQKFYKVEEILTELFKCRSLNDIAENVKVQTYKDCPGLEHYFYNDSLILEVEFIDFNNFIENPRWEFRVPSQYANFIENVTYLN